MWNLKPAQLQNQKLMMVCGGRRTRDQIWPFLAPNHQAQLHKMLGWCQQKFYLQMIVVRKTKFSPTWMPFRCRWRIKCWGRTNSGPTRSFGSIAIIVRLETLIDIFFMLTYLSIQRREFKLELLIWHIGELHFGAQLSFSSPLNLERPQQFHHQELHFQLGKSLANAHSRPLAKLSHLQKRAWKLQFAKLFQSLQTSGEFSWTPLCWSTVPVWRLLHLESTWDLCEWCPREPRQKCWRGCESLSRWSRVEWSAPLY